MNRKIIIIILLLVLSLFFMYPGTIKADTAQTINEQIVNETYKYTDNEPAGSCVEFVKNILRGVGIKIGAGYRSAYLNAIPAPTEVSMNDAKAGDVIQISNDTDETHFHNGMHAAIIFGSGNSNGYFDVVDSNWDRYPERDKDGNILKDKDGNIIWHDENRVKRHKWNPENPLPNSEPGLSIHIYRFKRTVEQSQIDNTNSQSANQPANLNNQTKPLNFIDKIKTSVLGLFNEVKGGLSNFGKIIGNLFVAKAAEPSNSQSATIAASQESQQGIQASTKSAETAAENTAQIPQPSKPSLTSPYNWYQSIGESPALRWQGDSNSASYYVLVNSSNTGNIESGWINSTSWKPNLPNENYIYTWKVKAKNSQGIEGPWSDESHFSTASTNLKFEGDISFSPPSPSSSDKIKIFASTTGWGGVGVTLRVSVNTAPDGSTSGEWRVLKELGVPKFNENDEPVWDTEGWANGTYRIRVEAKGPDDPNWQNPAVIEKIYKLINKTTNTDTTITKETESTSAETTTSSSTTTTTAAPVNAPPVEDLSLSSSSAQIGSTVKIHAKATWNSSFRAMRLKIDGNIVYELGSPEFNYDWNTSGCSEGNHTIRLEVAAIGDNDWRNPSVREVTCSLAPVETTTSSSTTTTTAAPVNAPPVEDLSLSSSSAQIGSTVKIHAKATWNSSFCAMRLKIDGNIVYELGSPEFNYDWNTSGCSEGNHTIRLEVAAIGDNDWRNPSVREVTCSLKSPSSSGLNKPTLSSPENGKLIPPGTDVTLNWNSVNGANQYYVEIWGGQYGSNHNNLGGWQGGTSRHIGTISPGNVLWRVKARDGSGNESPWSDEWNFTPQ